MYPVMDSIILPGHKCPHDPDQNVCEGKKGQCATVQFADTSNRLPLSLPM